MEQYGQVVKSSGDRAQVRIHRHRQCEKCSLCFGKQEHQVEAKNPISARPGQRVRLEMSSHKVLKVTFLIYLFPLFMILLGYGVGSTLFSHEDEGVGFFTGMVFLGVAYLILYQLDSYLGRRWAVIPTIKQIIQDREEDPPFSEK